MKNVLYVTNTEVPYRVRFFNELAKHCSLTVLYERKKTNNRDDKWTGSETINYKTAYLNGIKVGDEYSFSLKILSYLFGNYDVIIIGCYNSPVQMFAISIMRLFRVSFIINTDGEVFINASTVKGIMKKSFLKGAKAYLTAGEKSNESIKKIFNKDNVVTYFFSSLNDLELKENKVQLNLNRNDTVLVVGQYFDYKGLDVAVKTAKMDKNIKYKFVGMGKRTDLFCKECNIKSCPNVEVVPFLPKDELQKEYKRCAMLLLPSRQECWGLVINEAASFGMPIVSTWGSGAAVEFLSDSYSKYLAQPENSRDLYQKVLSLLKENDNKKYSEFLINKSKNYSIEKSVAQHLKAFDLPENQKKK